MIDPVSEVPSLDVEAVQPAPPALPRRSLIYRVFVGPRGVRAGWKVLIFFLLFAIISIAFLPIIKLMPKVPHGAPIPPSLGLVNEFFGMASVLIATALMAKLIDRKPWGYFGIPLRNAF